MDKIIIEGGFPLNGKVQISGSKNSALPCLFATLLTDEECVLNNVPDLMDIDTSCALLTFLGKTVLRSEHSVTVRSGKTIYAQAPYELVSKMRASALVLGPLLARTGMASSSLPGGCSIGSRPIDIHISGFESLGAKASLEGGVVTLSADRLKGAPIKFKFPSVGATENLLMAATLAEGETRITNAAREPEISDLADFLKKMGAEIRGEGTGTLVIQGRKKLFGAVHDVIPDRIEAATYLIAGAATGGKVTVLGAVPEHIRSVLNTLARSGMKVEESEGEITCASHFPIDPIGFKTGVYPKFPTDVQAQWMALMALADGKSVIEESIFENRFVHAAELVRMGASISVKGSKAVIAGVKGLSGANVMVSDLRAGAALVIAGLAAKGKTVIHRIYHLDRGYESLETKLKKLGAHIRRVK